jgi:hypothetical protein
VDGRGGTRLPAISYGFYMRSFCKSLGGGSRLLPPVQNEAHPRGSGDTAMKQRMHGTIVGTTTDSLRQTRERALSQPMAVAPERRLETPAAPALFPTPATRPRRTFLRRAVAALEARPVREPGRLQRRRAGEKLVALAKTRFGIETSSTAAEAVVSASLEQIETWVLRAHYQPCWEAVLDGRPLVGVRVVRIRDLFSAAIGNPLETWCLRAYYISRGDELKDTETIQWAALWLRENFILVGGLQEDLQYHRAALLSCESEGLARGLQVTVTSKRLSFTLYKPDGFETS